MSTRRSYSSILQQLFKDAKQRIEQERRPTFTLGTPTSRMLSLHQRIRTARKELKHCEAALDKLGARSEGSGLELPYTKRRALEMAWETRRRERLQTVARLRLNTSLKLLDTEPAEVKRHILKLQATLAKL